MIWTGGQRGNRPANFKKSEQILGQLGDHNFSKTLFPISNYYSLRS